MASFTLKITTNGAAFDDPNELPEVIRKVADKVQDGVRLGEAHSVMDSWGNTCGTFKVTGKR